MKIQHRIALRHDDPFWQAIERLGLRYDRGHPDDVLGIGISVLEVTEDQPEWPAVERLVAEHGAIPDQITNRFTNAELDAAPWLQIHALGHHSYPQPEDDFGYLARTYDLIDHCSRCGIGGVQRGPFCLKDEFKVSRSQFLQLNWVFDQFFLREEAREGLRHAGITGIEYLAPDLAREDRPSENVSQMVVKCVLPSALRTEGLQPVTCRPRNEEWSRGQDDLPSHARGLPHCGRVKYHVMRRGWFRFDAGAFAMAPDVVMSREWFGSGASAHRLVIVSQKFRRAVVASKWRGLGFEPIELVS